MHQEVLECFFLVFPTSIFTTEIIAIRDVDKNFNQNAPISGCFTLAFLNDKNVASALQPTKKVTDLDWHPDKSAGTKKSWIVFFSCLSNFNFHDRNNRNPRCRQKFQPEYANFGLFYTCVFERQRTHSSH